ncbi:MAG: hypothetical protein WC302_00745 [Candidatus Paceibacterota bacterium]|jgi:hypothetical protein
MSYKDDLEIDRFALDTEWMKQPVLFAKWGEAEAEAEDKRDKLKDQMSVIESDLAKKVREDPTKYGLKEKPTESAINDVVNLHPDYRKVVSDYMEAVKTAKIMTIATRAFEHRKRALEKESELWIAGYYSDPKIKSERREDISGDNVAKHREVLAQSPRGLRRRERTS